jgi:hypothetical protein
MASILIADDNLVPVTPIPSFVQTAPYGHSSPAVASQFGDDLLLVHPGILQHH